MKLFMVLSFLMLFIFKTECRASDTNLTTKARVVKIDTIDYYLVIHARQIENKIITIFSSLDDKSRFIEASKDSIRIEINKVYKFILKEMTRIKIKKDGYLFLNLRGLIYDKKQLLRPNELAYQAQNMYRDKVYK